MRTILINRDKVHTGNLILVNRDYEYHELLSDLSAVCGDSATGIMFDRRAGAMLNKLMAKINGWEHIAAVSAWRSLEEQQNIWVDSLAENGPEFSKKYVAVPGHSEHQTGLAIDLGLRQPEIDFIRPYFPYEGICQAFREMAAGYGFVERYPAEREQITHIGHEPWHFRYVGTPHAEIMTENGMVLEEYIEFLRRYCYGKNPYSVSADRGEVLVSYVKAKNPLTELKIDDRYPYDISGNNADGFIITEWRQ